MTMDHDLVFRLPHGYPMVTSGDHDMIERSPSVLETFSLHEFLVLVALSSGARQVPVFHEFSMPLGAAVCNGYNHGINPYGPTAKVMYG